MFLIYFIIVSNFKATVAVFVYLFTFGTVTTIVGRAVPQNSTVLKITDIDLSFGVKIM